MQFAGNGCASGEDFFPDFRAFLSWFLCVCSLSNCQPKSTFFFLHNHTFERPLSTLCVFYTQHYYRFTTRYVIYIKLYEFTAREKKNPNLQNKKLIGKKEIQVVSRSETAEIECCVRTQMKRISRRRRRKRVTETKTGTGAALHAE